MRVRRNFHDGEVLLQRTTRAAELSILRIVEGSEVRWRGLLVVSVDVGLVTTLRTRNVKRVDE